jgi:ATP-dependent DNA helicase RecG
MPRHFRLKEGDTQRSDQPLLPQKVVREAIINAVMHRDYQVNQPTLVVRYSNRLEIRNAGYSLKPEVVLGEMGSKLRNPILAAVLYDLDFAETKGSGIRTMRRLLEQAGLSAPVFTSDTLTNQFSAIYLLHQLLGEEQLVWLQQFKHLVLSDNEAKALILARETGVVDNASLRAVTGLDTLSASQVLRKLNHQRQLLTQGGAGSSTYYELSTVDTSDFDSNASDLAANTSDLNSNTSDLTDNALEVAGHLPAVLHEAIQKLTPKARKEKLHPIILWLCAIRPYKAEQLAELLTRQVAALKSQHLNPLREDAGFLQYTHPEIMNHPEQAYITTEAGRIWLEQQGLAS